MARYIIMTKQVGEKHLVNNTNVPESRYILQNSLHPTRKVPTYNHSNFEFPRLEDPPRSAMRHPSDNIGKVGSAQDGVHLGWEVRHPTRKREGCQRIGVFHFRKVAIVEERRGLHLSLSFLLLVIFLGCGTRSDSSFYIYHRVGTSSSSSVTVIERSGAIQGQGVIDGSKDRFAHRCRCNINELRCNVMNDKAFEKQEGCGYIRF